MLFLAAGTAAAYSTPHAGIVALTNSLARLPVTTLAILAALLAELAALLARLCASPLLLAFASESAVSTEAVLIPALEVPSFLTSSAVLHVVTAISAAFLIPVTVSKVPVFIVRWALVAHGFTLTSWNCADELVDEHSLTSTLKTPLRRMRFQSAQK